ncbi:MAG: 30S ribosomal protein S1 [Lachnospiraceae bacterium]|nr:30S ribosomal protein S1 [Lachnospiraceae bacterium]
MIEESIKTIRTGEIVDGTVISVKPDEIVLNIGYKSDGIITKEEFTNDSSVDLTTVVSVGDPLQVKILKVNDGDGQVALSYKRISEEKANKRVEEAFENKEVLTVKVEKVTTGGLITTFEGAKIFVPASLVSDTFEKDLDKYIDQEIEVIVTEFNPRKRRIIGNRRKILQATKNERAKELLASLQVNDIVEGEVKSVTGFGAFIDLGGVDGLLHISEMSWGRVDSPKSIVTVGDKIRVFIKSIEDNKIALSCKFPDQNPWVIAKEKYKPGTIVTGKVARMADFGAFIELEAGIDALLHVSQISKKHVKKPADVLKVGQIIDAKVVDFKEEEKKISLSRRDFEDDLVPDEVEAVVDDKMEQAENAQGEAQELAAEAAEEVKEEIAEIKDNVDEKVEEFVEDAKEKAEDLVEEAKDKVGDIVEDVKEKAEDVVAEAKAKVETAANEVAEKAEELKEKAQDFVEGVQEKVEEKMIDDIKGDDAE